jgi:hypothetical protein
MKVLFTVLAVFSVLFSEAQFRISTGSEFDITPPKDISAYAIYAQTSDRITKKNKQRPELLLKTEVKNGLRTKTIEMEDGKVVRIESDVYTDTLLQKAVVNYSHPKSTEVFYYRYDSATGKKNSVKGYKDGKLIYSYSCKTTPDTIEEHEFHNDLIKANTRTITYFSKDRLTETAVEYDPGRPYLRYTIKTYNSNHILLSRLDSSKEEKRSFDYDSLGLLQKEVRFPSYNGDSLHVKIYYYDSVNRLKAEKYFHGSDLIGLTNYAYTNMQEITKQYFIYNQDTVINLKRTITFDSNKNALSQEVFEYKDWHSKTSPPAVRAYYLDKRTYKRGRIIKYERSESEQPTTTFFIKYWDRQLR